MRREAIGVAIVLLMAGSAGAGFLIGGVGSSAKGFTTTSVFTTTSTTIEYSTITATLYSTRTLTLVQTSGQLGPWNKTTGFPGANVPSSCVTSQGYIYCVGGNGNATYFAQISSDGVGQWKPSTDYPVPIEGEKCVQDTGYAYCIGGVSQGPGNQTTDKLGRTSEVFYTSLSASGFGRWASTTPYPYIAASPRCMASASYVYCLEGSFNGQGYSYTPLAYYAPISSNGVGAWIQSNAPATMTAGCLAIDGYAYCSGGGECPPLGPGDCYSPSYSARLTTGGFGKWSKTTDIPSAGYADWVSAGSYLYDLAVPIFYAHVSNGSIATWETTTNYPVEFAESCASDDAYIFCIGESGSEVYYSQVGAPNPSALVLLNPPPYPRSTYLGPAWSGTGGCSVTVGGTMAGAPCFGGNIDDAVIFNCAVSAATASGCRTVVASPTNTAYNYNVTIWYPRYNSSFPESNCEFLPSLGYSQPFHTWCISISQDSFIIAQQLDMNNSPP